MCVFFYVFRSAINTGWVNVIRSTIHKPVNQSVLLVVAVGLVALFLFWGQTSRSRYLHPRLGFQTGANCNHLFDLQITDVCLSPKYCLCHVWYCNALEEVHVLPECIHLKMMLHIFYVFVCELAAPLICGSGDKNAYFISCELNQQTHQTPIVFVLLLCMFRAAFLPIIKSS
jgi:small neutral amino acid transporter SnatA (MarC family)